MATDRISIDRRKQIDLFGEPVEARARIRRGVASKRTFHAPDPREIMVCQTRLDEHLRAMGLTRPLAVGQLLDKQDWSAFEARYAREGRAPYAPRCMLGLILYGIMQGTSSLRGLEALARRDLGCMWVSGGITPDHANIGRFITLHDELLCGDFFENLTAHVLGAMGSDNACLAGDGTVIEAACSHYKRIHREAAREHAQAARREAEKHPEDIEQQDRAADAENVADTLDERHAIRAAKGQCDKLSLNPGEPEAMVQRLKRGRGSGPSYKPSVLANEDRVIVSLDVHASSETAQIPNLLSQSERITGSAPKDLLLDAGYCNHAVIAYTLEHDISLLCPQGRLPGSARRCASYYPKGDFEYRAEEDVYRCPAGQRLTRSGRYRGNATTPGYVIYQTDACADCQLRTACTRSPQGRRIKRYAGDDAKEALRFVMQQPKAKRVFSRRQAMVEPVFSSLRERQGLHRFRRRGLAGAKREFALHALAHNLARAIARAYACFIGLLCLLTGAYRRFWATPRRPIAKIGRKPIFLTRFNRPALSLAVMRP